MKRGSSGATRKIEEGQTASKRQADEGLEASTVGVVVTSSDWHVAYIVPSRRIKLDPKKSEFLYL